MKSPLLILRKWRYLFSTLIFWGITFTGIAQCGGPSFPASAEILSHVPEASGYNLVYDLPIPTANQTWASQADVPYSVNNSAAIGSTGFTRVAYYLKLESASLGVQWVWVSMNAFTNDLGKISIPTADVFFQQQVSNMNVLNYAGVNRTGIAGNLEFWSNCYGPENTAAVPGASDALSDFGDNPLPGTNCYGSFQVHDFNAGETLLAYNGWAYSGFGADDLGIGNCSFCSNPDWTTAGNANFYDVKELYVFVNAASFQPVCNSATLNLDAGGNATLTPAMVTSATVGTCGVQNIQLSKTSFNCSNRGANTVTVTFTVNGNTSTCNANVTVLDPISPVITATGSGLTLNCNPTATAIDAALGSATATDNCGTPALTVATASVVLTGNTYSQTRTWTATDGINTSTASRTVTWPKDVTPPVITATGSTLSLTCNPTAAAIEAALGSATATDNCGTATLSSTTGAVILTGSTYSQTRTWTATDGTNTSTASRTVTWPKDVTPPVITPTGSTLTLSCNPTASAIEAALGTATATDNCGTATLSATTGAVILTGSTYSQTRTWTATDGTNTSTASRTVTWPKDVTAPVITPTGSALTLGCNPTAAAIEAALGTATATDNCGTATLTVATAPVVVSGNNRSQTRTWTATDGTNSSTASRTATWTVNCDVNTPHTYPTSVSCDGFKNHASPLLNVCYKAERGKVKKVSPKAFYYYTNVTAPSLLGVLNSFFVDVVQTKTCAGFNLYGIQGNQVRAYDNTCRQVSNGSEISTGQGRVWILGATPGRVYTISVKYQTNSLEGSTYSGSVAPSCENSFVAKTGISILGTTTVVPGSQGSIKALPDCYNDNGNEGDDNNDNNNNGDDKGTHMSVVSAGPVIDGLHVVASPNPSSASFTVAISSNEKTAVTVRVLDVLGKPVFLSNKVVPNSTLHFGDTWLAGTYFAEIVQGQQRSIIMLVKQ